VTSPSPMRPLSDRPLDIILYGATGYTGKLVAEYLAKHAHARGIRWGIAGRNPERLEAVKASLLARGFSGAEVPTFIADAMDASALHRVVNETRVACTTVGPYARYGFELARAAAETGTSYCDLTGEPQFVRSIIDSLHETAKTTHARLVPCSGYDSIPSDLGTLMAWEHAHRVHGEGLEWAKVFVGRIKGGIGGGTVASALTLLDAARESRTLRRLLADPHGLDPDRSVAPRDPFENDQRDVRFDKDLGRWTAPFVMATINARIVRRSHALLREHGQGYGPHFRYHEAMSFGRGPSGLASATLVTATIGAAMGCLAFRPTRALLERFVVPLPGEGPTREQIETGFFETHVLAKTESGRMLRGIVSGTQDPGYGETAKMIAESAMCLAKDEATLEKRYGVLTPATAMGMRLIDRLRDAAMTFEMGDA
jgi:short subunit dehydrogenase-like uncharacterized protein